MEKPELSNENQIKMYLHCSLCIEEYTKEHKGKISPKDFSISRMSSSSSSKAEVSSFVLF